MVRVLGIDIPAGALPILAIAIPITIGFARAGGIQTATGLGGSTAEALKDPIGFLFRVSAEAGRRRITGEADVREGERAELEDFTDIRTETLPEGSRPGEAFLDPADALRRQQEDPTRFGTRTDSFR